MHFEHVLRINRFAVWDEVKTNLGHSNEASGMISLLKTILILQNGIIPPTLNFQVPNNNIDFINSPVYIVDKPTPLVAKGEKALISMATRNSGTNVHIIVEEAPKVENKITSNTKQTMICTLSAKSEKVLFQFVNRYKNYLQKNRKVGCIGFCIYLNVTGRSHYAYG